MSSLYTFSPIIAGFLVLITYAFVIVRLNRHKEKREELDWNQRMEQTRGDSNIEKESALSLIKDNASTESYFQSKIPKVEGMTQWIQQAGFEFSPVIFIGAAVCLGIGLFFLFFYILKIKVLISLLIGVASSFILPWGFLAFFRRRQKKKFMAEFPLALDIMRRALRAGYSTDRALEMVAEQQETSIGKIFRMISDKMRLGEPAEQVLTYVSNRIEIDEFRMLAIVFVLQRETGGSLAEATENFSKVIRARESLRKKIFALTGEVRMTAMILCFIPFGIFTVLYISSPRYLDPLFYTDKGNTLLLIGLTMLGVGMGVIIRMTYKEIY